jgi:hypothetical protein
MMRTAIAIVAAAGLAPACGGNDKMGMVDAGELAASGTVVGPMAAEGPVVVLWQVDNTPNDYSYKLGDGTATATMFDVPPLSDPPAAARTRAASVDIGVGILVLLRPGASLPDGALISRPNAIGYSLQYAIIYRGAADSGTGLAWTAGFPVGLSCGKCVPSPTGFDTFKPVDCATLVIDTNPAAPACNWN